MHRPLIIAGVVLGFGLGGFLDGILLHQILGWHHMICTTATCQPLSIEHLQRQNTQDGFFHLAMWFVTLLGIGLLFRAAHQKTPLWSAKALTGSLLAGWGTFNFLEGLINHQILNLHHVLPGHPREFFFDMLFLASGLGLIGMGTLLVRSDIKKRR